MKPPTAFFSNDGSDSDTPEKCRNRRLRRINMRRMRIASLHRVPPPNLLQVNSPPLPPSVKNPMPEFGCISIQGRGNNSMDHYAVFVKEEFLRPDIFGGMPLHFFAVYDGRGGSHVSEMCKKMMHKFMEEELTRVHLAQDSAATGGGCSRSLADTKNSQGNEDIGKADEDEWERLVRVAVEKSFARMDQVALSTCACGRTVYTCECPPTDLALAGSTAALALLSRDHVVVANYGDSRAVLSRDGIPVPHSLDHKLERQDDMERIKSAGGGKLLHQKGVRVYGGNNLINMSPSLEPEISISEREDEDEDDCLILASDGIWDVISEDVACRVANECLREGGAATAASSGYCSGRRRIKDYGAQMPFSSKSNLAAAILCRLALGRGSHDNISVIVVDLKMKKMKKKNKKKKRARE